jgi:hypothetical protein
MSLPGAIAWLTCDIGWMGRTLYGLGGEFKRFRLPDFVGTQDIGAAKRWISAHAF